MEKYKQLVEKHRKRILDALDYIWKNPETGYREWKTHAYMKAAFEELGYTVTEAGDIPGFTAEADTGRPGPTLLVFGEMDGLLIPKHPESDPVTGAVHACGHCAQAAALIGVAAALKEPGALDGLCGKVRLVAVPAEESVEMEFRKELFEKGIIRYYNGKPEFLRRGLLDGGDLAFMVHLDTGKPHGGSMNAGSNGLVSKIVTFKGVSAHAGGAPHKGVNALYAANLALNAINALRETFRDDLHIRVHPIITRGGDSVNAIPDEVQMQTYVRGANMQAIADANKKVNRAIAAAAAAMGAKVHIDDDPGAWPRRYSPVILRTFRTAMEAVLERVTVSQNWGTGCSDMGDISAVMPMVHPYVTGASGTEHGNNYRITDPETAGVDNAKVQFLAIRLLLEKDGAVAKEAIESYTPDFGSIAEFLEYKESLRRDDEAVFYEENGSVTIRC